MRYLTRCLSVASGALAAILLSSTTATAQDIHPLLLEGDLIPGVGHVDQFHKLTVNDKGTWLAVVKTNCPDPVCDEVLLENGVVIAREGDPLLAPLGTTIENFHEVSINAAGEHACGYILLGSVPPILDEVVYFEDQMVLLAGTDAVFPQFSLGTKYIAFLDVLLNDNRQMLISAHVDDPKILGTLDHALLLYQLDASGNITSSSILWKEGDILPGQLVPVADFNSSNNAIDFNNKGDVLVVADLEGNTALDGVIYLNGTLLAQEGSPSPLAGRTWGELCRCASVALNNNGDHVFRGELNGDPATKGLIVKNGQKFIQTGDLLTAVAPYRLTNFTVDSPVLIDDDGHVLWWGEWDDPDTTKNSGLFLDYELIVQKGVSTALPGYTLVEVDGYQETLDWSSNHRHLVFEGKLDIGVSGLFLIELPIEPTSYCAAKVNSLGCAPAMYAMGTPSVSSALPFMLNGSQLINKSFGLLAYGFNEGEMPFMGGTLCISGSVKRTPPLWTGGNPAIPPDCSGSMAFDFNAFLQSGLDPQLLAGVDVFAQFWSRDNGDAFGINLTDAVKFTILQ